MRLLRQQLLNLACQTALVSLILSFQLFKQPANTNISIWISVYRTPLPLHLYFSIQNTLLLHLYFSIQNTPPPAPIFQYTEHPSPCTYIPLLLRMGCSSTICFENVDIGYGALCLINMPLIFIILGWVFKFYRMVYEKCTI